MSAVMDVAPATADKTTIRAFARHYMALGWKLCGIKHGSKGPDYPEWQKRPLRLDQVDGQGLGLLHALSGTCAIDVDDVEEARPWLAAQGIDLDELLGAHDAVQIQSSRPNRAKLLYKLPDGVASLPTRKHATTAGKSMIEFRCASAGGTSVQDVLPPTIHPDTGKPYQWGGDGDFRQLPTLRPGLLALWQKVDEPRAKVAAATQPTSVILEGGRNDALFKMGGDMARQGLSATEIEAALQTVNLERCVPPLGQAEVATIARSASKTSRGAAAARAGLGASGGGDPWPDPTPLPNGLPPVMPFDADLLPEALRPWVMDIAHRMQCPPDFPAVGALVAVSSLVGARAVVQPKAQDDWQVVPNLWGMVVGRPGVMKSPALAEVLKPLRRLQAAEIEQWQFKHDTWELDCKVADLQVADNEKKAKGIIGKDKAGARRLLESIDKPAEPLVRRFCVNDATVEKLGELLVANPWGTLAYRDELYGLLTSLDKQGQEGSRAFYLQGYDGNQGYTFDRILRGTVHIPRVCLAMLGGIQPGRIQEYVRSAVAGGSGDDGLVQRFGLSVWPDVAGEFVHVDQWPDTPAQQAASAVLERLCQLAPDSETESAVWHFDPVAQELFVEWRIALEQELKRGELHPAVESHLAKYRKLIPALALLFALIDTPDSGRVIQVRELERALAWGGYLRTHANRLYAAAVTPETSGARALLIKIRSGKLVDSDGVIVDSFTPRQVAQKGWTGLNTADAGRKAAELLVDYDWLKREVVPGGTAGGRPSERYIINPATFLRSTP